MKSRTGRATNTGSRPGQLYAMVFVCAVVACSMSASAQDVARCGGGYRVIANRWDAVLRMGWELRQNCAHPDWPARSVVVAATGPSPSVPSVVVPASVSAHIDEPLLVHAGDQVRLWMQGGSVHIEMTGVAERSARNGEPVIVRITRQTDDAGLTVQRIPGTVRGAGDVEMER